MPTRNHEKVFYAICDYSRIHNNTQYAWEKCARWSFLFWFCFFHLLPLLINTVARKVFPCVDLWIGGIFYFFRIPRSATRCCIGSAFYLVSHSTANRIEVAKSLFECDTLMKYFYVQCVSVRCACVFRIRSSTEFNFCWSWCSHNDVFLLLLACSTEELHWTTRHKINIGMNFNRFLFAHRMTLKVQNLWNSLCEYLIVWRMNFWRNPRSIWQEVK